MNSQDKEKPVRNYIILYGLVYLVIYSMISGFSSVFKTYLGYATIPALIAVFTASRYAKENDKPPVKIDKIKLISGTFILSLLINILFTANVIGEFRSIDHIDGSFVVRQIMQLVVVCFVFGTNSIYSELKK